MLKSLKVSNFTVFGEGTNFDFVKGINVVIWENGLGKSHVLKLAYALTGVSHKKEGNKYDFEKIIADKLKGVFRPNALWRLSKRVQGRAKTYIEIEFDEKDAWFEFSFASNSTTKVNIESMPKVAVSSDPVFFPTHEVLSIYPWFTALYENRETAFDETYYDLCKLLDAQQLKGKRQWKITNIIEKIEETLNGRVVMDNQRFYFTSYSKWWWNMEAPLMAEWMRKVWTIMHLLANWKLIEKWIIFWDEPETNLNPRLIKVVADLLLKLAQSDIQIIIATHSLFLLKEIDFLAQNSKEKVKTKYFSLSKDRTGDNIANPTIIEKGESISDIQSIAALDEEIVQAERFYNSINQ